MLFYVSLCYISTKKLNKMNTEIIKQNLEKVTEIVKEYDDKLDETGSRFNIFYTLNWALYEVNHSNFIAELLNQNGTHSFGNEFCKHFFDGLKLLSFGENCIISGFNFDNYVVEVEKSAGEINQDYTNGGRIDITITDNSNKRIIIENKIYASDQQNQLLRYHNFDKSALLLYLTLDGKAPTECSTNNKIQNNTHFHCISYYTFITKWLKKCIQIAMDKPRVSQTISQYLDVIRNYTHQNHKDEMTNEIMNLIANSKELYSSMDEINQAWHNFRGSVYKKFQNQITEKIANKSITAEDGITVKVNANYLNDDSVDDSVLWFGFFCEQNGKPVNEANEVFPRLVDILTKVNPDSYSYSYRIGFIEAKRGSFYNLHNLFELNNNDEMNKFTSEIIEELDEYIEKIKSEIEKLYSKP